MYLISYDLKSAEADYEAMYSAIQALGASLRVLDSTWIVDPPQGVGEDEIATRLHDIIHAGDRCQSADQDLSVTAKVPKLHLKGRGERQRNT